ncbi:MAG: hypothetical protein HC929_25430 [Leptolyngbyaceae cyanobacterium SM2_5_2]|nr:hypothetical protein [Leptolyngbyaceae cyanobacterium SM2_5_2]
MRSHRRTVANRWAITTVMRLRPVPTLSYGHLDWAQLSLGFTALELEAVLTRQGLGLGCPPLCG